MLSPPHCRVPEHEEEQCNDDPEENDQHKLWHKGIWTHPSFIPRVWGQWRIKMVLYWNSVSLVHFLLSWKTWEQGSYSVWSSFRGQAVPLGLLTLCEAFCIAAVVLCLQLQEGKNKRPHTISCLLFTFSSPLPRIRACAWPKCSHTHTRTHPWLNRSVGQFTNSGEDVSECKRTMTN